MISAFPQYLSSPAPSSQIEAAQSWCERWRRPPSALKRTGEPRALLSQELGHFGVPVRRRCVLEGGWQKRGASPLASQACTAELQLRHPAFAAPACRLTQRQQDREQSHCHGQQRRIPLLQLLPQGIEVRLEGAPGAVPNTPGVYGSHEGRSVVFPGCLSDVALDSAPRDAEHHGNGSSWGRSSLLQAWGTPGAWWELKFCGFYNPVNWSTDIFTLWDVYAPTLSSLCVFPLTFKILPLENFIHECVF